MKRVNWAFCLISFALLLAGYSQLSWGVDTARITSVQAQLFPTGMQAIHTTLELPHRWDIAFPQTGGTATYTAQLPVINKHNSEIMGLFIARVGNQATVTLNGKFVANLGMLGESKSDYSKLPQWIPIPAAMLTALAGSSNELKIEISTQAGRWGGLSSIEFGTEQQVKPLFEKSYRTRTSMNLVICLSFLLMGSIVFALWIKQKDALYLIFLMTAASGAFRTADRLIISPPLDWPLWGVFYSSSLGFLMLSLCAFSLRLIDRLNAKEQAFLWLQALLTLMLASASLYIPQPSIWTIALLTYIPTCLYTSWQIVNVCKTSRKKSIWLLLLVFIFLALVGLRDLIAVRWAASGMDTSSYLPHAMFIFVLVMAGLIVNRYGEHYKQARHLSEHLGLEVKKKEEQIKLAYAAIHEQTKEHAAILERQRMMSDIHDGVGAQLVSLVNQTQNHALSQQQVREQASAALDELRMAVDALQPNEGDLLLVLATLRYRLEPRLKACNIRLIWAVEALPTMPQLDSHRVIQIQRIVYQAITNIIEHAQATTVTIRAGIQAEKITLVIQDNGKGFDAMETKNRGVGLQSMAHRASDIGAYFAIDSYPTGTTITLLI